MTRISSPHVAADRPEPGMHQHPANEEASATSIPPPASSDIGDTATTDSEISTNMGGLTPSASRCSTPTQTDGESDTAALTPTSTNRSSTPTQEMDTRLGYDRTRATSAHSPDGRYATTVFGGSVTAVDNSVNKTEHSTFGQNWNFDHNGDLLAGPFSTTGATGGGANQTFNFTSGSQSSRTRSFNYSTGPNHGARPSCSTSSSPSTARHHHHEQFSSQTLRSGDTFTNCTLRSCSGSGLTLENCTASSCSFSKSRITGGTANSCGIKESQVQGGTYNFCGIKESQVHRGTYNSCGIKESQVQGGAYNSCSFKGSRTQGGQFRCCGFDQGCVRS